VAPQQAYTEQHLAGLKVSHSADTLPDGQSTVLVLKDAAILDDDEDVLENVNLAEKEKVR
jgi:U4/U6.U5 tri-snRNP-associated protein 1